MRASHCNRPAGQAHARRSRVCEEFQPRVFGTRRVAISS